MTTRSPKVQIKIKEFSSAAEMREHYRALKRRTAAWRKAQPRPAPVPPPPPPPPLPALPPPVPPLPLSWQYPRPRQYAPSRGRQSLSQATVNRILFVVARHFSIEPDSVFTAAQGQAIMLPRTFCYRLAQIICGASEAAIGRAFNRDRTTVIHALKRFEEMIASDPELRRVMEALFQKAMHLEHDLWTR